MNIQSLLSLICAVFLASSAHAQAPVWSDSRAEVWTVVKQSWEDDVAEIGKWPGEYTHESFIAWGDTYPTPRDKGKFTQWERKDENQAAGCVACITM